MTTEASAAAARMASRQLFGGDVDGGRGIAVAGSVEADEGVEVDDAAALELGHLGEVDRDVVAQSP